FRLRLLRASRRVDVLELLDLCLRNRERFLERRDVAVRRRELFLQRSDVAVGRRELLLSFECVLTDDLLEKLYIALKAACATVHSTFAGAEFDAGHVLSRDRWREQQEDEPCNPKIDDAFHDLSLHE